MDEERDAAVDEFTDLVLDRLLPAVQRYQGEVARGLGLGLPEFQCLELLRVRGPLASGFIGSRTGLSRSTVSKMLRRLEDAGHVRRTVGENHAQGVEVELVPHTTRDILLGVFHRQVRTAVRSAVATHGLHRPLLRARAAGFLIQVVDFLQAAAADETLERWRHEQPARRREAERVRERRRREGTDRASHDRSKGW
ncbi:MarR family transcriptional regulator [Actinomycetospora termitidis]|uniref:MarR family transcriptional regulator n=1 Tax=Actinomycetospora termitidis TaxID=3053470 RepID=A0ABT7MG03_9PSEU|nr:MarR family transcriptional regulator [Actinomycetospora sp. Odt1-22]MDL5159600.1 MarR family transcriptional regulator [Actinomycetospora sp. Odt1-22]